jgi:chaperonin GroEL (HSP60 family)
MVVRRAMKFNTIVAGGGAIEMEISRFFYKYI